MFFTVCAYHNTFRCRSESERERLRERESEIRLSCARERDLGRLCSQPKRERSIVEEEKNVSGTLILTWPQLQLRACVNASCITYTLYQNNKPRAHRNFSIPKSPLRRVRAVSSERFKCRVDSFPHSRVIPHISFLRVYHRHIACSVRLVLGYLLIQLVVVVSRDSVLHRHCVIAKRKN